jgi:hypothetical protein
VTARRVLYAIAALVALLAIFGAIKPFHTTVGGYSPFETPEPSFDIPPTYVSAGADSAPIGTMLQQRITTGSCGPPIVDAWHSKSATPSWSGYAPLNDVTVTIPSDCRGESQHLLGVAASRLLAALVLIGFVWFVRRVSPGPSANPA